MHSKWSILFVSLVGFAWSLGAVQAKAANCTIDVQPIVAKLIEAQTAAAAGKQSEAIQQITSAKADLEAIEANCSPESAASIPLGSTFNAPDGSFEFKYPDGWAAGEFKSTLDVFGKGGTMLIGSNKQALSMLTKNVDETQFEADEQAVMVIVGSANSILYSLGIYDEKSALKGDSSVQELTEYLQLAIKDGPLFAQIGEPVYDKADAQFTISDKEFDGLVLLKELGKGQYALTLMLGDSGTSAEIPTMATAIHSSIQ